MDLVQAGARWLQQVARNDRNGRHTSVGGGRHRNVGLPAHSCRFCFRPAGGSIVLGLRGSGCTNESEHAFRNRPEPSVELGRRSDTSGGCHCCQSYGRWDHLSKVG